MKKDKDQIEIRVVDVSGRANVLKGPPKPKLRIGFIRKPRRRISDGKYINFYDV